MGSRRAIDGCSYVGRSETGPHTTATRPDRDASELAVLQAALERDVPLLAVCRGMQLLNVLLGGTLLQHLPAAPATEPHQLGLGIYAERKVRTAPGSALDRLIGPTATVNCHHHQALDRIASALTPTAWAEDGVVEGVEDAARPFCLAVQWHPETGEDFRLFEGLVAASSNPAPRQVDSERASGARSSTSTAP